MRCADCRAWEKRTDNNKFGYCKRHSPRPEIKKMETGFEYQIIWPSTGKDDWCCDYLEETNA